MTVTWYGAAIAKHMETAIDELEEEAANNIEVAAKKFCAEKSKALRESIKAFKSKYKDGGWFVRAGGGSLDYASFIELGVPSRNIKKRPFLRRAWKQERKKFNRKLKAIL